MAGDVTPQTAFPTNRGGERVEALQTYRSSDTNEHKSLDRAPFRDESDNGVNQAQFLPTGQVVFRSKPGKGPQTVYVTQNLGELVDTGGGQANGLSWMSLLLARRSGTLTGRRTRSRRRSLAGSKDRVHGGRYWACGLW